MAAPQVGPCSAWASTGDLCSPCDDYSGGDSLLLADMLEAASGILYRLSGRQFPGLCETTVRPCGKKRSEYFPGRGWRADWGSCGCYGVRCGCSRLSAVSISHLPLISVEEVKVDGAVVDPSLYRVDEWKWLVRLPDPDGTRPGWPCCQRLDLDDTEDDTFSVTATVGREPDAGGIRAAAVLACELAKACDPTLGGECRLPKRITTITRQQVTMAVLDPQSLFDEGRTGLPEVDLFLASVNPHKVMGNATVMSPDVGRKVWRTNT